MTFILKHSAINATSGNPSALPLLSLAYLLNIIANREKSTRCIVCFVVLDSNSNSNCYSLKFYSFLFINLLRETLY